VKKLTALLLVGALIVLAAVMSVSAMPDEGDTGGRAIRAGSSIQVDQDTEAVIDCVQSRTGNRLTREELKDLRIELAMNVNHSLAGTAVVACSIQNQTATK
jgi:hypothetical protein